MTSTDKLIAILSRAEVSLDDAMLATDRRGHDCANAIDDAQTRVAEALEILREMEAEQGRDLEKQAALAAQIPGADAFRSAELAREILKP